MIPYGIVIRENKIALQQSFVIWQRKFGLLKAGKFIKESFPVIFIIMTLSLIFFYIFDRNVDVFSLLYTFALIIVFSVSYFYLTAMKTIKQYAETAKEKNIQLVLKDDVLEITTEFSKEEIPYDEIDCCYEKDFLVTLIYDKNNFPLSVSKTNFIKGDYDIFVSLLKEKIPGRYEKKGEN